MLSMAKNRPIGYLSQLCNRSSALPQEVSSKPPPPPPPPHIQSFPHGYYDSPQEFEGLGHIFHNVHSIHLHGRVHHHRQELHAMREEEEEEEESVYTCHFQETCAG